MVRNIKNILITGGAGFIGSHVVRNLVNSHPECNIVVIDCLTYAGNMHNLDDVIDKIKFYKVDICDYDKVKLIITAHNIEGIIHLAAESHVDRSILGPTVFAQTNVMGTLMMLEAAKTAWKESGFENKIFYHISTDEVYGSLEMDASEGIEAPFSTKASSGKKHLAYGTKFFTEDTKYDPHSPYSASKASSDHFVRAYHNTYGLPVVITNCSNNYGPNQFPEKLIPLFINSVISKKALPVYGTGENVRDWLYVEDHAKAIETIFFNANPGETYNIGGFNEIKNIDLIKSLIRIVDKKLGRQEGEDYTLINYVSDRLGHDCRYAIDSRKLQRELGWEPSLNFEEGLEKTVDWYLTNKTWLDQINSGEYLTYSASYE